MAFRYRQITPQAGDIINPDDWNVNVREYTNEFNGHLDRDNLPEKAITTSSIKADAFHQVESKLDMTAKTIQGTQTRFKEIQVIEFESQYQGIVMCEWSGNWLYELIVTTLTSSEVQDTDFRILVNGTEITRIRRDNNLKKSSSGYTVGALPVEAGMIRVSVEVKTNGRTTNSVTYPTESGTYFVEKPTAGSVTLKSRELVVVLRKA